MNPNSIFSGNSRFATDFQAIIDRSLALASLPLDQLNKVKSTLNDQATALNGLDTQFAALSSAIQGLQTATGTGSLSASVSSSAVSAAVGSGAKPGTYTIEVTNLGAFTSTLSSAGTPPVTDPTTQSISSASSFTLAVNGTNFTITPSANTLQALADAINQTTGTNVQASIVNVGSPSAADYRLSIQGVNLEADTIQLSNSTSGLLTTLATGAAATYKVNGLATAVSSTSRTVTLAPGLTVQLLAQSPTGVPTTITVSRDASAISKALTAFASAYNSVLDQMDKQHGEQAGALAGQGIVTSLSSDLNKLVSYAASSGAIASLTDLGLVFDSKGRLSLDSTIFSQATANGVQSALAFLGSSTTSGFLKAATDNLNSVEDPTTGILKNTISSVQGQITEQDQLIARDQDRIDRLRDSLQAQMASADALIASLEQQVNYFNNLFVSMRGNAQR